MRILTYLAVPYSHEDAAVKEFRFRQANIAASTLSRAGDKVFSPISQSHPIALAGGLPTDWEYWKEFDTAILGICRKLVVLALPGWVDSIGVQAELEIASSMAIPCLMMRDVSIAPDEALIATRRTQL